MSEFEPLNQQWFLIDAAQRRAVLEFGYGSPQWDYVRRIAEEWLRVWT